MTHLFPFCQTKRVRRTVPLTHKNGTIEIAARDKSMKEIVPQAEAVDFAYNYVVKELEKLECRL